MRPTSFCADGSARIFRSFNGLRCASFLGLSQKRKSVESRSSGSAWTHLVVEAAKDAVGPWRDDPFIGNLATPVNNSSAVNAYIGNLPAYRKGLSPRLRGLEIGMAHGYFLVGPFVDLGPLRNSELALIAGTLSAVGLVLLLASTLELYGKVTFSKPPRGQTLWESGDGWEDFVQGWMIGGLGSVGFAFLVLQFLAN